MDIYKIHDVAELIEGNSYVGRGIIIGKTPDAKRAVSAYFIMGRSENSRNRVFTVKNGEVFTEPFYLSILLKTRYIPLLSALTYLHS